MQTLTIPENSTTLWHSQVRPDVHRSGWSWGSEHENRRKAVCAYCLLSPLVDWVLHEGRERWDQPWSPLYLTSQRSIEYIASVQYIFVTWLFFNKNTESLYGLLKWACFLSSFFLRLPSPSSTHSSPTNTYTQLLKSLLLPHRSHIVI